MAETIYLTKGIRNVLASMCFGAKEKIALLLGDRVSKDEIYVTNTTGAFESGIRLANLEDIPQLWGILTAVRNANIYFNKRNLPDEYLLFLAHSHNCIVGQIVNPPDVAWTCYDISAQYESFRGKVIKEKDLGKNEIYFYLQPKSEMSGDDKLLEMTAAWGGPTKNILIGNRKYPLNIIEYYFFIHPPQHLVGKPMTNEVAIDCFKYDPQMALGKIRKIAIAQKVLTQNDLVKTLLDPTKPIVVAEEGTGNLVLPYRR